MFSEKEIEAAHQIINGIMLPAENEFTDSIYWEDISNNPYFKDMESKMGAVRINAGATRMVFIPERYDFVIKVNFDGTETFNYNSDEEDDYIFRPYHFDYNDEEMNRIRVATEAGFGSLFLEMEPVATVHNRDFYLQRKATHIGFSSLVEVSADSRKKSEGMRNTPEDHCHVLWRARVIELYGESFWKNLVKWDEVEVIRLFDDMHGGNYGYCGDRPVFVDVGGFYESDCQSSLTSL